MCVCGEGGGGGGYGGGSKIMKNRHRHPAVVQNSAGGGIGWEKIKIRPPPPPPAESRNWVICLDIYLFGRPLKDVPNEHFAKTGCKLSCPWTFGQELMPILYDWRGYSALKFRGLQLFRKSRIGGGGGAIHN